MAKSKSRIVAVAVTFSIVQLFIILGLLSQGRKYQIGDMVVTTAAFLIFTIFEIRYHLHIGSYVKGLIIAAIFSHTFIGLFWGYMVLHLFLIEYSMFLGRIHLLYFYMHLSA